LFECRALAGVSQLLEAFNAARDDDYEEVVDRCTDLLRHVERVRNQPLDLGRLEENGVVLVMLRERNPDAIDAAFAIRNREAADRLIGQSADRPIAEVPQFVRLKSIVSSR
jgi:hypothetical protein